MTPMARGRLVVISAPSGAGKSTIARAILEAHPTLEFSVSATTRQVRNGEQEGRDYFFLTKEEFRRRIEAGDFVEWEEIYGNYYGTLRQEVDRALESGQHILFDIDVKGGLSIRNRYPESLLIFIRPPSLQVLRERLRDRKTENDDAVSLRMERVPLEMQLGVSFDYQVVNDDLPRAIAEVNAVVSRYLQVN
jgi:guanylate kinase